MRGLFPGSDCNTTETHLSALYPDGLTMLLWRTIAPMETRLKIRDGSSNRPLSLGQFAGEALLSAMIEWRRALQATARPVKGILSPEVPCR
jgi:hypothetical protein